MIAIPGGPGGLPAERAHRLDGVETWIGERLVEAGLTATGPVERTRDRSWSTQLRVPTDAGPAWFKANCAGMAFEPALHARLAELLPEDFDVPLGVQPQRGWLLTRHRGATLHQTRTPTARDWADLLGTWARVQRVLAGHAAALLATGVPERRPEDLPARHEAAVAALAALPAGHPARLAEDEVDALCAAAPRVAAAAHTLHEAPLPVTLQHGDLHPGNVFATPGGLRLFDFGDAQWAAAAEALVVPWRVMMHDYGQDDGDENGARAWAAARAAYRATWATWATCDGTTGGDQGMNDLSEDDLAQVVAAALTAHAVHRAGTWLAGLAEATEAETAEWGGAPRAHLLTLLEAPDVVADIP